MTVGFNWLLWLLVGALGDLLALLSAVASPTCIAGDIAHRVAALANSRLSGRRATSDLRSLRAAARNCPPSRCYREILESIALYCNPN